MGKKIIVSVLIGLILATGIYFYGDAVYKKGWVDGYNTRLQKEGFLRDPTYQELMDFLAKDETDKRPYQKRWYVCLQFATELNNNAEKAGFRAAFVFISYSDDHSIINHAIVAFNTTDQGLIYVEPQKDKVVKLEVNKSYSELNGLLKTVPDDIIRWWLIIW